MDANRIGQFEDNALSALRPFAFWIAVADPETFSSVRTAFSTRLIMRALHSGHIGLAVLHAAFETGSRCFKYLKSTMS